MNSTQRAVKYCAMAFAIILAVGIISGMASVLFVVMNAVSGNTGTGKFNIGFGKSEKNVSMDYDRTFTGVNSLNIENGIGSLNIKVGDEFRVEAYNVSKKFEVKVDDNGRLNVSDHKGSFGILWFNLGGLTNPTANITVYVPSDFVAKEVLVDTGAGTTNLEGIHTDYLFVDGGAGSIHASDIRAKRIKWDGGVGTTSITNVYSEDSNFNCGVGKLSVSGKLLGETNLDCGIGEVILDMKGEEADYGYKVDTGIGKISLNNEKISGKNNTNARNLIKVDGGVGSVKITIRSS